MSDFTPEPAGSSATGPTRLNGWKDIAAYLDRGVRTVQRWEKEFGLPVRRLGPGRGEGVFAFTHEIDAWQSTAQAARARSDSPTLTGDGAAASLPDPSSDAPNGPAGVSSGTAGSSARRLKTAVVVMAAATTLALAWSAWSTWQAFGSRQSEPAAAASAAGSPASWRVEGDSLVVVDGSGRTCWKRRMPTLMDAGYYGKQVPAATGGVGDIDGDGRPEVWIIVVPAGQDGTPASLHLFNGDGSPRWVYRHTGGISFGRASYDGPWITHRVFVTEDPEDANRHALWVSSRDASEFPALLVRLDIASGKPVAGPYWNAGWLSSALLLRTPDGPRLVVGVTNNDQRAPGIVMLDATNIAGSLPAEHAKYTCGPCPPGEPLAVAVFPKPRRFEAVPGGGGVDAVFAGGGSAPIQATITYAFTPAGIGATAVFRLDAVLRPLQADPADNYMPSYQRLAREGIVPAYGPVPDDLASELLPIRIWDRAARRFVPAPLAKPSR